MQCKHETLVQYWLNVGRASATLAQHKASIWPASCIYWSNDDNPTGATAHTGPADRAVNNASLINQVNDSSSIQPPHLHRSCNSELPELVRLLNGSSDNPKWRDNSRNGSAPK